MNYNFEELTFPSSDGKNTVYAEIYTPKYRTAKGIVQLAHGMKDHVTRYTELADYLCDEGYIFAGNHHLGHGRTASSPEDLGFFAERDGVGCVLDDLHTMNRHLRHTFPSLPLFMLGHSMGSFLSRLYVLKHQHSVKGHIIMGTGGRNRLLPLSKLFAGILNATKGARHRSELLTSLAFRGMNKRFPKEEGRTAWLTRDGSLASSDNKYNDFIFTSSAYRDLFEIMGRSNGRGWYDGYPKNIPTLIVSGDSDPVGKYGKGPNEVYKGLVIAGCSDVTLKLYEGARHELFRETCKEEFFLDLTRWLDARVGY